MEKKTSSLQGSIGDKNFIQKKVTTSAKYGNVQSKLSGKTGASAKNVSTVSDNLVTKRKGEKHKRIKPSTLAKLMTESAYEESIYNLNEGIS
jgi:hypothetical protein